jgi:ketopantoate reductase
MHVAIVGAGSIGRVIGVRLAEAGVAVAFVVRTGHPHVAPIRVEAVLGSPSLLEAPAYVEEIPAHADVVLVCVRGDQLDEALVATLRAGPSVPVVSFAPMLPKTYARLRAQLGDRLVAGMSSVTGYTNAAGVTRYWVSQSAKTVLDEPRAPDAVLSSLVEALGSAGVAAQLEAGVHETSAATTISFLPLALGLDAAGSLDGLMRDDALRALTFRAMSEGRALAQRCGKVARWAGLVTRFLGPHTIRLGLSLGRSRAPEALAFVEEHFGRKIHAQNVAMAEEACALAGEKGTEHLALGELLAKLRRSPA